MLLGLLSTLQLMAAANFQLETKDLLPNASGYINPNDGLVSNQPIAKKSKKQSSHEDPALVVFKADTSECRIGIDNRALIEYGLADFVTTLGGNDFTCCVLKIHPEDMHSKHFPYKRALKILPENGYSFSVGVPRALNPNPPPPFINEDGPALNGLFDHVKFLAYSVNTTAPAPKGKLCSKWVASGAQLNVELQPFGSAVKNPEEDCRLACYGLVSLDTDLLVTNDWLCTNDVIYALVERLPGVGSTYASYTYAIPVFKRSPCQDPLKDVHTFELCYDRAKGTMTWILDGRKVLKISQFGVRLNEGNAFVYHHGKRIPLENATRFKIIDHGGVDTPVTLINIQSGISFFTLLDAYRPNNYQGDTSLDNIGLVRLESSAFRAPGMFFYNDPLVPDPNVDGQPALFVQDSPLDIITQQHLPTIPWTYRLFGQGAELLLFDYEVLIKP